MKKKRIKEENNKEKANPSKKNNNRSPARIKVVGVGGGGGNVVSRMREDFLRGVEFIAVNTDAQDLDYCHAHKKIYIGKNVTRGLGAGMNPELGRQAAEENRAEIVEALQGADLVFVTAGFGGGTGSSASIVVAEAAKEVGALTIGVFTKPFSFEGGQRGRIANEAVNKIKDKVDSYIIVPNDRVFSIINKETSIAKAFEVIDDVLRNAVHGIAELITMPGIINIDFADVKAVMQNSGSAIVGIGISKGKDRSLSAVQQAMNSPLVETTIEGARGILFGISGGRDLKMSEIHEVAKAIADSVDGSAKIIFGAYHDRRLKEGRFKVTLIATGFNGTGAIVKKPDYEVTNLFGEKVKSSFDLGEVIEPKLSSLSPNKNDSKPITTIKKQTNEPIAKVKRTELPELNDEKSKKGITDIWDIPAFLRKKNKDEEDKQ